MSTKRFPTFSPSSIIGLLNSTIHGQQTVSTTSDGRLMRNTDPHNGLLLITAFFTALKLINIVSGYMGKPKQIREVVTGSSSAAAECATVFGGQTNTHMGYPASKSGASVCWLCGFTIDQMGQAIKSIKSGAPIWSDSVQNANAANAPECEHIVPAGAAMIYLDIPSRKRGTDEGKLDLYVNYEWSHKFCNATASDGKKGEGVVGKSDKLFFDMLDQRGNLLPPAVNTANIGLWLSKLAETKIMSTLIGRYGLTPDAWMNAHGANMSNRVKKVCDYIVLKRANYPRIFGKGPDSQLGGDAVTPATPSLGDPEIFTVTGLMVGDLLNLARNVSIVYNELLRKSINLDLLESKIFSQSMLYLKSNFLMVLTAINQNRETLVTQGAFFNPYNNNGLLNGVFPVNDVKTILAPPQYNGSHHGLTLEYIEKRSKELNEDLERRLPPLDPETKAEVEGRGDGDSWTYDELMSGAHNNGGGGKRKKTHRNKLKRKRTRRNKKSKK